MPECLKVPYVWVWTELGRVLYDNDMYDINVVIYSMAKAK